MATMNGMDGTETSRMREPAGATIVLAVLLVALLFLRWQRPVMVARTADGAPPIRALPDMRIDLNACSESELLVLPGIGPSLARRIIDDRNARGPFASLDDLERVGGIGPKLRARVTPWVVVEQSDASEFHAYDR